METASCSSCDTRLESRRNALGVVLHGFGDEGIIDTFDGEISVILCETCATHLIKTAPWAHGAWSAININVAHVCTDGERSWVPQASCTKDPDRHGWRKSYLVIPTLGRLAQLHVPLEGATGKLAHFGAFASEEAAQDFVEHLRQSQISSRVCSGLVGNECLYEQVDAARWSALWPELVRQWAGNNFKRSSSRLRTHIVRACLTWMIRPRSTWQATFDLWRKLHSLRALSRLNDAELYDLAFGA